jgi:hypothetical protein
MRSASLLQLCLHLPVLLAEAKSTFSSLAGEAFDSPVARILDAAAGSNKLTDAADRSEALNLELVEWNRELKLLLDLKH